jgi:hypothetical protein
MYHTAILSVPVHRKTANFLAQNKSHIFLLHSYNLLRHTNKTSINYMVCQCVCSYPSSEGQ